MTSAQSNSALPGGKSFVSEKKLEATDSTLKGATFHVSLHSSRPSQQPGRLATDQPTAPARKNSEASFKVRNAESGGSAVVACPVTLSAIAPARLQTSSRTRSPSSST